MPSFLFQFSFSQISPLPFHPNFFHKVPSYASPSTLIHPSSSHNSSLFFSFSFLFLSLSISFVSAFLTLSILAFLPTSSSRVDFPASFSLPFFPFFFFFAAITDRRASCYFPGVSIRNNEKSFSRSSLVLPAKWYACTVHRTRFAPGDPFVTGMYFEAAADGFFHRRIRLINLTAWIWNVFLPSTSLHLYHG